MASSIGIDVVLITLAINCTGSPGGPANFEKKADDKLADHGLEAHGFSNTIKKLAQRKAERFNLGESFGPQKSLSQKISR